MPQGRKINAELLRCLLLARRLLHSVSLSSATRPTLDSVCDGALTITYYKHCVPILWQSVLSQYKIFFYIYNQIVTLLSPFFYFFLEKAKEEIRTANPNPYWEAEEEEGAVGCQQAATGHPTFVVQASVAEARTNQGLFAAGRRIYSKPRASQVCFFFFSLFFLLFYLF